MTPIINNDIEGHLKINNQLIEYDFFIDSEGDVKRRHQDIPNGAKSGEMSLSEASDYYDPNINELIIGWRTDDKLMLSNEAVDFFDEKQCKIKLLPLSEAITYWNRYEGHAVGLFHVKK